MTPSIVEGLTQLEEPRSLPRTKSDDGTTASQNDTDDSSLNDPEIGNPISHGQIVDLWRKLKTREGSVYSLEKLLRGAHIYNPPPQPKPEPSDKYKALMARLRRDEEARAYGRLVNPELRQESFHDRFPSATHAYAEVNRPSNAADIGDDEISFNEVHRQVTLIINFLVSIAGVAGTLWIAARWWSVSARLFLTLGGSILVAVAEVVVYSAYMWRMEDARGKQAAVKEVKEVVETWVVGDENEEGETVLLREKGDGGSDGLITVLLVRCLNELRAMEPPSRIRKPLRTYGKRPAVIADTRGESPPKKRRKSTDVPRIVSTASSFPAEDNGSLKEVASRKKEKSPTSAKTYPTVVAAPPAGVKKGSIMNYFRPLPATLPTMSSSPKSDEVLSTSTPPSSPPPPVQAKARKKPRILKFKGGSLPKVDTEDSANGEDSDGTPSNEEGQEPRFSECIETERGSKEEETSTTPRLPLQHRKDSLSNQAPTDSDTAPLQKKKQPKSKPPPTVQTTLNISAQAAFSECKVCDTVWNPLYPPDVKYHLKQHASVLRAKRKKDENDL
ncbi:hypothetical protein G7046_g2062 [Stylonectria norvegica]|nr:hypothetical protein G7046_g2062 [Stylonectria norvegica]